MFLVDAVDAPGGSWENIAVAAALVFGGYFAVLWSAIVYWTARDAHQRVGNPAVELGAALMVLGFFLPGLWVYLILRPRLTLAERLERSLEAEAVLSELADRTSCPQCAKRVQEDFLVCPSCKYRLKEPCSSCAKPLSFAWIACPGCGADNRSREEPPAVIPIGPGGRPPRRDGRRPNRGAQVQPQLSGGSPGS